MEISRNNDNQMQSANNEAIDEPGRPMVHYVCGSCGKDNKLDENSVIRCHNCGHRIFYKKRERKLLQYEAR